MPKAINITGQKFGKLVAIKFSHINKNRKQIWFFKCDCGTKKVIIKFHVIKGNIKSCGCLLYRKGKDSPIATHGLSKTRFYAVYIRIIEKCIDKNSKDYKNYGGRGIKNEWKSFEEFRNDMYKSYLKYKKTHSYISIDRIDNNGNYSKKNCRWADYKTQERNRRDNILLTYKGVTKTLPDWAEKLGINVKTLSTRYWRKWPIERMFQKVI